MRKILLVVTLVFLPFAISISACQDAGVSTPITLPFSDAAVASDMFTPSDIENYIDTSSLDAGVVDQNDASMNDSQNMDGRSDDAVFDQSSE